MTDLHNPWPPSEPLAPDIANRLLAILADWKLDDAGAAFVLQIRPETWASLRHDRATPLDRETRMRVSHVIDMSDAMDALEPGVDQAEWLRRPHDILHAFAPLHFLLIDGEALRSMRFTMMMDAYPGWPDVKRGQAPTSTSEAPVSRWARWRALWRRWAVALFGQAPTDGNGSGRR
jgi:hypothetical protein